MNLKILSTTARSVTILIEDGGFYYTKEKYTVNVNLRQYTECATYHEVDTTIFTINDLHPDTEYEIRIVSPNGTEVSEMEFKTEEESVTFDVQKMGAKGNGRQDDTIFIQSAIAMCPPKGRVLINPGKYKISSLFLKSGVRIELKPGAMLIGNNKRNARPMLPGSLYDNKKTEYHFGTWEGNPDDMYTGIISGYEASDVVIYGGGTICGGAGFNNWWKDAKKKKGAWRPRTIFLNRCKDIRIENIRVEDSPSWTIHPFFSENVKLYNLSLKNPPDSPNTDGIDPESCKNVEIAGVRFNLGDDCIAIKSGKIYMGKKYKTPSQAVYIHNCLMERGHGAVTMGSECAGGIKNVLVEKCDFRCTDRGLRIKTRRDRGEDSVLDNIVFKDIKMDHVMTPFTANAFYFCDPDGMSERVRTRVPQPVDETTPVLGNFVFENIEAKNCHVAATYFAGLPEKRIASILMKNIYVDFADKPTPDVPIMAEGVPASSKKGIHAEGIDKLILENVVIEGFEGEEIELIDVGEVCRR